MIDCGSDHSTRLLQAASPHAFLPTVLLLNVSQMNRTTFLAIAMLVPFVSAGSLSAQQPDTPGDGTISPLLSKLQGTWRPVEVNINGQPSRESQYGPSVFVGSTWTMQTTNGDHVYELSTVKEKTDPVEIVFVHKAAKTSFIGLLTLAEETLTIARGTQWTNDEAGNAHIPRPDSATPGRSKIVYTWKRASAQSDHTDRPSLTIRLVEEEKPKKILAEHTIQSYFGGKLEYVAKGETSAEMAASLQAFGKRADGPVMLGIQITGSIEDAGRGEKRVVVAVQLGNAVSTEDPETAVVRTESVVLKTILKPNEEKRINCGGNRWCELLLH